ncbi:DUF1822 family protein [Oscillatoria sp. CS-180]|uniref:DUF1822 family protein n=1 Tax=Oscillatoria sp. CS-180 TaxID=3021720 RepID=UPI0023310C65|nr:DUF1822 family protein [Oscillatoria sp. CS-180]MDB9524538.1 DUF1822 family protein [Oscillatoria sp. CS-180]
MNLLSKSRLSAVSSSAAVRNLPRSFNACCNAPLHSTRETTIMSDLSNPSAFTIPLALTAHRRAKDFQRRHSTPSVQKRVYLNTLAVYAGATHLEMCGYEVELNHSYSHDPAQQTLMNVADIWVAEVGRLECRPVLPGENTLSVPAEVMGDRVCYLAIQLDDSLRHATLLGFAIPLLASTQSITLIPLSDLQSPEELGTFLEKKIAGSIPVQLSRWLQQTTETGWQTVSDALAELTAPSPAFAFRGSSATDAETETHPIPSIGQTKSVTLGSGEDAVTVSLLVGLIPQAQDDIEVWVQISPAANQARLPSALQLAILDDSNTAVMQAEARDTEAIQLKFVAAIAEQFSVRITLGDQSFTARFEV